MPISPFHMSDIVPVIYKRHTRHVGNRVTTKFKEAFHDLAVEVRKLQPALRASQDDRIALHTMLVCYGHGEEADKKLQELATRRLRKPTDYPDGGQP